MIDVSCRHCGAVYHSEESHIGKQLRCARCGCLVSIVRAEGAAIQGPPTVKNAATRQVKPTPTTPFKRHFRLRRVFIATAVLIALVSIAYVIARRPAPEHGTDTLSDIEEPAPSANSRADKPLDSTSGGFTIVAPAADTSRTADPAPPSLQFAADRHSI